MPPPKNNNAEDASQASEFTWTWHRCLTLLEFWTIPLGNLKNNKLSIDSDPLSSRALALFLIAALAFAVRGPLDSSVSTASFTALAAGIAAALSFLLRIGARKWEIGLRNDAIISVYTSVIVVMALFISFQTLFGGEIWYREIEHYIGAFTPAILGAITAFALLFAKAKFWDQNKITGKAIAHGVAITLCAAVLVFLVSYISKDVFDRIIHLLSGSK